VEDFFVSLGDAGDAWYIEVIHWVQQANIEDQLMKLVHEELAQFFDVVNEREFAEIQVLIFTLHMSSLKFIQTVEITRNSKF
jgi:hypothetical protein